MTSAPTDLTWTALTLDDVPALAELFRRIEEVEQTGDTLEEPSIREWLTIPGRDLEAESVAVRDGDRLLGFAIGDVATVLDGEGRARVNLGGGVDPAHRRRGVGTALFDRVEEKLTRLAARKQPGAPAFFRTGGGRDPQAGRAGGGGADVRPVLDRRGYRRVLSWFEMVRDVPGAPIEVPDVPGVRIVAPGEDQVDATRLAHNAAFADHWGSTAITAERWARIWHSHTARPDLSSIAVDGDGTVLAYCVTSENRPEELYVALVGTRPEGRGRGLARAVMARSIAAAADAGFTNAELEVDTESLTGATRVYESVGFARRGVYATYEKPVA